MRAKRWSLAERILWQYLRKRRLGTKFRRGAVIDGTLVSFYAPRLKIAIQVGRERLKGLTAGSYRVLYFRESDVLDRLPRVVEQIKQLLDFSLDKRKLNPYIPAEDKAG